MEEEKLGKKELIREVVGFDVRKFWFTFLELTRRPGKAAASYCDGKRSLYVSAVTYFLIAFSLNFLATKFSGIIDQVAPVNSNPTGTSANQFEEFFMMGYSQQNPGATPEHMDVWRRTVGPALEFMSSKEGLLLVSLPVFIILQWLFFKDTRKSFIHHAYFILFVSAQTNFLTLPLLMLPLLSTSLVWPSLWVMTLGSAAFFLFAESQFNPSVSPVEVVARTIGMMAAGILPFLVWFCLVLIAAIVILSNFVR